MARGDPVEHAMIRLELRRFASRCDTQEGQIRRADTLREVARLANIAIPYRIAGEMESRDLQRRVAQIADERAREIIQEQIDNYLRAEQDYRAKWKNKMTEDWPNLTGPLAHLRTWAQNKLNTAEQSR